MFSGVFGVATVAEDRRATSYTTDRHTIDIIVCCSSIIYISCFLTCAWWCKVGVGWGGGAAVAALSWCLPQLASVGVDS